MACKENIVPALSRQSKIPVPKMKSQVSNSATLQSIGRGTKRKLSLCAERQNANCSSTLAGRTVLGDVNTDQRNISKVCRMLEPSLTTDDKTNRKTVKVEPTDRQISLKRQLSRYNLKSINSTKTKTAQNCNKVSAAKDANSCIVNEVYSQPVIVNEMEQSLCPKNQIGIQFEKDAAALESILNNTGIQLESRIQVNMSRHTVAATSMGLFRSTTSAPNKNVNMEDFKQLCDDYINKISLAQKKEGQYLEHQVAGLNGSKHQFSLSVTPTKADFCGRYSVSRNSVFQIGSKQSPNSRKKKATQNKLCTPSTLSRQSLQARTVKGLLDPFIAMGRQSLMSQTPMRVKKDTTENVLQQPQRCSLIAQQPQSCSLLREIPVMKVPMKNISDTTIELQRFSLASKSDTALNIHGSTLIQNASQYDVNSRMMLPSRISRYGTVEFAADTATGREPRDSIGVLLRQMQVLGKTSEIGTAQKMNVISESNMFDGVKNVDHTPQRVPKTFDTMVKIELNTEGKSIMDVPCKLLQTPQRVLRLSTLPLTPAGRVLKPEAILLKQSVGAFDGACFQKHSPLSNEGLDLGHSASTDDVQDQYPTRSSVFTRELWHKSLYNTPDLKSIWKTKKMFANILKKEINSSELSGQTNTSQPLTRVTSTKKKKTLTWANTLESRRSFFDDFEPLPMGASKEWSSELETSPAQHAMQDKSDVKKAISSPNTIHDASTSKATIGTMQLPLVTCPQQDYKEDNNGNQSKQEVSADLSHQNVTAQSDTDSSTVTQLELGHRHRNNNVLANKDEFLQQQIQLFEDQKCQLYLLQMEIEKHQQQLLANENQDQDDIEAAVTKQNDCHTKSNAEVDKVNVRKSECSALTQGLQDFKTFDVNINQSIDVNSNVTFESSSILLPNHFSQLMDVSIVGNTMHSKPLLQELGESHPRYDYDAILRTKLPSQSNCSSVNHAKLFEGVCKHLSFEEQLVNVSDTQIDDMSDVLKLETGTSSLCRSPPVNSAPKSRFGEKTLATQQFHGNHTDFEKIQSKKIDKRKCDDSSTVMRSTTQMDSDRLVLSDVVHKNVNECILSSDMLLHLTRLSKIPMSSRASAFHCVGHSAFIPFMGSLPFRGHESYIEASFDEEVTLYTCQMVADCAGNNGTRCHDPVSTFLLEGDAMHFMPIESLVSSTQHNLDKLESTTFSKYAIRST